MVIGVGEGVSLGAGAAAAVAAGNAKGNRGGLQQAFVASLMFRREAIPEEEARENPALRALSAYRAVAFPFGDGSAGGEGGRFPVAVVDALVEKPRFVLVLLRRTVGVMVWFGMAWFAVLCSIVWLLYFRFTNGSVLVYCSVSAGRFLTSPTLFLAYCCTDGGFVRRRLLRPTARAFHLENCRRKDTGDGDGGYGSGGDGKDDKGKQKTRKFKVRLKAYAYTCFFFRVFLCSTRDLDVNVLLGIPTNRMSRTKSWHPWWKCCTGKLPSARRLLTRSWHFTRSAPRKR